MTATLEQPVTESGRAELEQQVPELVQMAQSITIRDQATLDAAGQMLTERIKPLQKQADDLFDPIISAANKSHKAAIAAKAKVRGPLDAAEIVLKDGIDAYCAEQDRLAAVEAERLRKEQEERDRVERERLEKARLEEQARLNEELVLAHAEEVEAQIEAMGPNASPDDIAKLCATPEPEPLYIAPELPMFSPVPAPAPSYVAPKGISRPKTFVAEVTDLRLLCRAIADGKAPVHYVSANMTALNQLARAQQSALVLPGVRAIPSTGVSARSSR
jgi:hypothetical protein